MYSCHAKIYALCDNLKIKVLLMDVMQQKGITVQQARAVQEFSPASWTITETPSGWVVHRGDAVLISTRSKETRTFSSLDKAVKRLGEEIGVYEFKLSAARPR
jgi:hypothetical protein